MHELLETPHREFPQASLSLPSEQIRSVRCAKRDERLLDRRVDPAMLVVRCELACKLQSEETTWLSYIHLDYDCLGVLFDTRHGSMSQALLDVLCVLDAGDTGKVCHLGCFEDKIVGTPRAGWQTVSSSTATSSQQPCGHPPTKQVVWEIT